MGGLSMIIPHKKIKGHGYTLISIHSLHTSIPFYITLTPLPINKRGLREEKKLHDTCVNLPSSDACLTFDNVDNVFGWIYNYKNIDPLLLSNTITIAIIVYRSN